MTEEEHRAILQDASTAWLLFVDRAGAREFFGSIDCTAIRDAIGEPLHFERAVVTGGFLLAHLLLYTSVVLAAWSFGWWSMLVIPLSVLVWMGCVGRSTSGGSAMGFGALLLGSVAILWLWGALSLPLGLWALSISGAICLVGFTYAAAAIFVKSLVVRNWRACDLLLDRVVMLQRPTG